MNRYAPFFPSELSAELEREVLSHDGVDLSVGRRAVPDARLTCIVLHGAGGNSDLVTPLANAVAAAGFEAVAPDLPGYGRTEAPAGRLRYEDWVEAVRALAGREAAGGRAVVAFGLSMGGMLAYHAACATEAIRGVAATNLLDPSDPAVMRVVARSPLMARTTALLVPALDRIAVPIRWLCRMDRIANDPELVAACIGDPRGGGSTVPLGFLRTWMGYRPAIPPEGFDRPVLLCHPGADRWTPTAVSMPFFERLGGPKRFAELENCGHAPIEEPGASALREELARFLRELEGAARQPTAGL